MKIKQIAISLVKGNLSVPLPLRLVVSLSVLYFLASHVDWDVFFYSGKLQWGMLVLAVCLLPVNFYLESKKLYGLYNTRPPKFSIVQKGVYMAASFAVIMPLGLAQITSFSWVMPSNRFASIRAVIVGRFIQILPSLLFGMMAMIILGGSFISKLIGYQVFDFKWYWTVVPLAVLLIAGFALKGQIVHPIALMALAHMRYVVFLCQYILVTKAFIPDIPIWTAASSCALILTLKSVIPAFGFLFDLGVREFSALLILGTLGYGTSGIVQASLAIWVINFALPAILGVVLILHHNNQQTR